MLHDADPTNGDADPPSLPRLEDQVGAMGPLIDQELERVDRRHAQLTRLSHELVDALSLYHSLMREMPGPGVGPPPPDIPLCSTLATLLASLPLPLPSDIPLCSTL